MSRTNVSLKIKAKNKKEDKYKKDPRPKIGDFPNREAYRQAVLKWRVRNGYAQAKKPKEKKKYVSPRERKFGKSKLKANKEIEKKVDKYVADRKVPINRDLTKDNRKNVPNKENKKDNKVNKEKVVTPKYKQVTQAELDAKLAKDKKSKEKLKVKPKKMHAIEKRNRERFGDAHVDKLKARYKAFKEKRKKKKK